jgi:hypothetical protein
MKFRSGSFVFYSQCSWVELSGGWTSQKNKSIILIAGVSLVGW